MPLCDQNLKKQDEKVILHVKIKFREGKSHLLKNKDFK